MSTEKISDNKYLCPLSGKKFKGPEFVRKHIFNKHMDKVDAVKKEVWSGMHTEQMRLEGGMGGLYSGGGNSLLYAPSHNCAGCYDN